MENNKCENAKCTCDNQKQNGYYTKCEQVLKQFDAVGENVYNLLLDLYKENQTLQEIVNNLNVTNRKLKDSNVYLSETNQKLWNDLNDLKMKDFPNLKKDCSTLDTNDEVLAKKVDEIPNYAKQGQSGKIKYEPKLSKEQIEKNSEALISGLVELLNKTFGQTYFSPTELDNYIKQINF